MTNRAAATVLERVASIKGTALGRFLSGSLWATTGAVFGRVAALGTGILLSRACGREAFGQIGLIQSTVLTFGVLGSFGLGATAAKHVAEYRTTDPHRAAMVVALSTRVAVLGGGFIALVAFATAEWLASLVNESALVVPLRLAAFWLALTAVASAQNGVLQGLERFDLTASAGLVTAVSALPLSLLGWKVGGVSGAIMGFTAAALLGLAVLQRSVVGQKRRLATCQSGRYDYSILWHFGLPAALAGVTVAPVQWVCAALVAARDGGFGELGLFNAANQWRIVVVYVPQLLGSVAFPILANLNGDGASQAYRRLLLVHLGTTLVLSAAGALFVVGAAPWIMAAYGDGYVAGIGVLRAMAVAGALAAAVGSLGHVLASKGKMWVAFAMNLVWSVAMVTSTWRLRNLGAQGLAGATLLSYSLHFVIGSVYLAHVLRPRS